MRVLTAASGDGVSGTVICVSNSGGRGRAAAEGTGSVSGASRKVEAASRLCAEEGRHGSQHGPSSIHAFGRRMPSRNTLGGAWP
ncbi:hypothetical protein F751_3128 [Auxenochlorella protothecoides]|uniref:Uncharacterized protein n=1 Tax=Auxenochlorella protothecoides TaxID=3075 RepID=A0A087SFA6_AUXPR|nr:hypothetical protein F751_3128 [Auxenochlorella protothecoides]KFM24410.1 hypothetical protein F751_3128 [Auxenochlorella protothecoides]